MVKNPTVDYHVLRPDRLFAECARPGNREAWVEFVDRYHKTIVGVVTKTLASMNRASTGEIEEMAQEVYTKICDDRCRTLRNFRDRGKDSDFGYLKVVAIHAVYDMIRRNRVEVRDLSRMVPLEDAPQFAVSSEADFQRTVLLQQVSATMRELTSERDRLIFDLFYKVGFTAAEIAGYSTVGLEVKGVESVLKRVTRSVREKLGIKNPEGKTARGALS